MSEEANGNDTQAEADEKTGQGEDQEGDKTDDEDQGYQPSDAEIKESLARAEVRHHLSHGVCAYARDREPMFRGWLWTRKSSFVRYPDLSIDDVICVEKKENNRGNMGRESPCKHICLAET